MQRLAAEADCQLSIDNRNKANAIKDAREFVMKLHKHIHHSEINRISGSWHTLCNIAKLMPRQNEKR